MKLYLLRQEVDYDCGSCYETLGVYTDLKLLTEAANKLYKDGPGYYSYSVGYIEVETDNLVPNSDNKPIDIIRDNIPTEARAPSLLIKLTEQKFYEVKITPNLSIPEVTTNDIPGESMYLKIIRKL